MTTTEDRADWFENYSNIVVLVDHMADTGSTAKDIAYAVEKPWKHGDIYAEALAALDTA